MRVRSRKLPRHQAKSRTADSTTSAMKARPANEVAS
jgi:hypothetical protein